jgi:hypothetical protein
MKLLSHALPQVRQFLRQSRVFTTIVVVCLLALEILGRFIVSDAYDTLTATGLLMLFALVVMHHREQPLGWVHWTERHFRVLVDWFDRFRIEIGLDLRGKPPIPQRTPPSVYWTMLAFAVWGVLALTIWYFVPQGWRGIAIQISYIGYLIAITFFWGLMFACWVGCIYLPIMLWCHLAPQSFYRSDAPRMTKFRSLVVVLIYIGCVFLAGIFLPMWTLIAGFGLILAILIGTRIYRPKPEISMIWRPRGSNRVYSVPGFRMVINFLTLVTLFCIASVLTAAGGRVFGSVEAEPQMTVTVLIGVFFAWSIPGMFASVAVAMTLFWLRNPARPCKPIIHISGYFASNERSSLIQCFKQRNWNIRFDPVSPKRTDVSIHLVEPEESQANEFDPSWPLHLSLLDLQEGSVFSRLERRDELQKRQLFFRGLRRIFRDTRNRDFKDGAGYWLIPHLWIQPAMTRDEEADDRDGPALMQSVGPAYREVFARSVRHYLHQVLRALEIDVIFIEDGVKYRQLKRLWKRLFEFYDKSHGQRRAEEVHFQGIPKIRIMIHDLQLDMPFESNRYPEPKYEMLGRARILHIFRDRGDQEDLLEVPGDFQWSPAPMKS